ncbi:hypothetical protein D9611_015014 [Ephemerocybe angulata]|uniref:Neuroguidin n=1 Tax=Ephemerocybe angulata TaxID=980116 RepID=A0A8H5CAV0_9AGAR|nr:hypothetical protein D9611_015014 [Tulosesus angulatus]
MTSSITASRTSLKSFMEDPQSLDFADGISLLSLKHNVLISYLRTLALLSARRALGHSLEDRKQPTLPLAMLTETRPHAISNRKAAQTAEQAADADLVTNDPLAFKPNPQNLVTTATTTDLTRMTIRAGMQMATLSIDLLTLPRPQDPSRPHVESSTGLGGMPSLASGRAKHLKRITEYEEENFTRLMMKKTDAKRRARDEEDLALGDEFGDIFRSVHRVNQPGQGDGYDELRKKGKKQDILSRSRDDVVGRKRDNVPESDGEEGGGRYMRKRTRFDLEAKSAKKKLLKRKK